MHEFLDKENVLRLLEKLRRCDSKRSVFGSAAHDYKLNPPIRVSTIEEFEAKHGIRLPGDYRYFITQIGNGGAGPYYGLFSFGQHDDSVLWEESELIGDVSQPFTHAKAWNLSQSFFEQEPNVQPGTSSEEEDRLYEEWDKIEQKHYWDSTIVNGAIPICHLGCALRQWLVVSGDQKGFIWNDFRADHRGIVPLQNEFGEQMTFSEWYVSWLNESSRKAGLIAKAVDLLGLGDRLEAMRFDEARAGCDATRAEQAVEAMSVRHGVSKLTSRRHDLLAALLLVVVGVLLGLLLALWRA